MDSNILSFLEEVLAITPGNLYWKDIHGNYLGCNKNLAKALGLSSTREIIGKTNYDLLEKNLADEATENDKLVFIQGNEIIFEENGIDVENNPAVYLTFKKPIKIDNQIVGLVGISVDITERKKIERELQLAREAADAANHAKTAFLANISHDIKTPIAGIISTAEFLSESITDKANKKRSKSIVQSGLCLLEIMNDVIEQSRLGIDNLANYITDFNLKKLIDTTVKLVKPAIDNKNLYINVVYKNKLPQMLRGNYGYIYRIVLNLVSNAIKFTETGGVTLEVELLQQTKEEIQLKISVADTGIGITKNQLPFIFDKFHRATSSYEGIYKGWGMGLYIVQQFAHAIGGTIYVNSEVNIGSIFTGIFPLKIVNSKKPEAFNKKIQKEKPKISPVCNKIKILFVEDNEIAAEAGKDILQSLGCEVEIAPTGLIALEKFSTTQYDLIFLDLGLPDIAGLKVAQEIRQLEKKSGQKNNIIVVLSAHVDAALAETCLKSKIDTIYSKPLLKSMAKEILEKITKEVAEILVH